MRQRQSGAEQHHDLTVQVNTGGDKTSQVLKDCASSADKFYLITDPDKTVSVFNSIGQSLSKLRVSL